MTTFSTELAWRPIRIADIARRLADALRDRRAAARTRRALSKLDAHLLRDIGQPEPDAYTVHLARMRAMSVIRDAPW